MTKSQVRGREEIRIAGAGGQGIIKAAYITGKAVSIHEGREATVMEVYGPESRGGASSGTIVIDDEPVDYPYVTKPDALIILSEAAYIKYRHELKENGMLVVDKDLVDLKEENHNSAKIFQIPAQKFAEELGRVIVTNIVMLGFFVAVTGLVKKEAMLEAVLSSVPPKTVDLNRAAFEKGYAYGIKLIKNQE